MFRPIYSSSSRTPAPVHPLCRWPRMEGAAGYNRTDIAPIGALGATLSALDDDLAIATDEPDATAAARLLGTSLVQVHHIWRSGTYRRPAWRRCMCASETAHEFSTASDVAGFAEATASSTSAPAPCAECEGGQVQLPPPAAVWSGVCHSHRLSPGRPHVDGAGVIQ